jgi:hypothetical protein
MNNNYTTLHKVLIKIVDEGKATIKLGTPESKALIDVLQHYKNITKPVPGLIKLK